jgi:hypothetical protein
VALPKGYQKEEKPELPKQFTMLYLKEDPSKVKLRVLSDFIQGKEVFGEKDGKPFPYRFKVGEKIPVTCIGTNRFNGEPNQVKGFLAAIVWSYTNNQVEILCAVNNDIKDGLVDLENNDDWGDLKGYDITISRKGQKKDTRYSVVPSGMKPFSQVVDISGIDLEALYSGENPFKNFKRVVVKESQEDPVESEEGDIPPF